MSCNHGADPLFSRGKFVSWAKENGRTRDLAQELGLDVRFVYPGGNTLLRYIRSFLKTIKVLKEVKGGKTLVMLPPTPLLIAAVIARWGSRSSIYFDLHTGFFHDPKWRWATKVSLMIMRKSTAIVTNQKLADHCKNSGVKAIVLHDFLGTESMPTSAKRMPATLVCPVSYSNDEPIDAIISAARSTPEITWVLTGTPPETVKVSAPSNVEFPGFVDDETYSGLITTATAVVALTNRQDTMQRAAYEAIILGTPVITSDFQVLKDFFEDAALYVEVGEANLVSSARSAVEAREGLREAGARVLSRRQAEQLPAIDYLKSKISG